MKRLPALFVPVLLLAACGGSQPETPNAPAPANAAHAHNHTPASNAAANAAHDPDMGHGLKIDFNWDALKPPAPRGEVVELNNEKDPVTLKPAQAAITTDYKGFRVRFESEATRTRFLRKSLKYLNMLSLEPLTDGGVKLVDAAAYQARATEFCPMMPESEVDPHGTVYLLHRGFKIYFCCWTGCGDAFMREPAKYYDHYGLVERDGKLVTKEPK